MQLDTDFSSEKFSVGNFGNPSGGILLAPLKNIKISSKVMSSCELEASGYYHNYMTVATNHDDIPSAAFNRFVKLMYANASASFSMPSENATGSNSSCT